MKLIYLMALVVTTAVTNVVCDPIPTCSIWHPMGRIPHESDCTKYYQCFFGIPRLTSCPIVADRQTYFFPTLEVCIWSSNSPCDKLPPPPPTNPPPPPPTNPPPPPPTNPPPPPPTNPPPPPPTNPPPPPPTNPPPPPPTNPPPPPPTNPPPPPPTNPPPPPPTNPPPPPPTNPPPPPSSSTCDNPYIPDPTHRPDDCVSNQICNSPIKNDCKHYYQWIGNDKVQRTCGENFYYDIRVQACTLNACPSCPKP